jgi:hypothetical protein
MLSMFKQRESEIICLAVGFVRDIKQSEKKAMIVCGMRQVKHVAKPVKSFLILMVKLAPAAEWSYVADPTTNTDISTKQKF